MGEPRAKKNPEPRDQRALVPSREEEANRHEYAGRSAGPTSGNQACGQPLGLDPQARLGTYWGIDTDPSKVAPPGALPAAAAIVDKLAHLPTRLSDLGTMESKQLINWGYAICDRCIRTYYNIPALQQKPVPQWPYPDARLG